jgi:hypothetical protein
MNQKGGLFIKSNNTPEQAFHFFIDNCNTIEILKNSITSWSGAIFICTLKESIESPYELLRYSNARAIKSPVHKIIVKLVAIDDEGTKEWSGNGFTKRIEEKYAFTKEANVQTSIFLKTITHLNPICPAPVFASVIKSPKSEFIITTMKTKCAGQTLDILLDFETNIKNGTIPALGILAMEIADGYMPMSDCYNHLPREDVLLYENMARLKILDLAIKTGYSQNDFHMGNILVNPNVSGYYKKLNPRNDDSNNILGNILIIDFGFSSKLPNDLINEIKNLVSQNKYIDALHLFYDLKRPDGGSLNYLPAYGWLYFLYDKFKKKQIKLTKSDEKNKTLSDLKMAEQNAIQEMPTYTYDKTSDKLFEGISLHALETREYTKTKKRKSRSRSNSRSRSK